MNKLIISVLVTLVITSCNSITEQQDSSILSEQEAKIIAEKTCIKWGESLNKWIYNENSKTWWFDANLNATKPGCNPACVVSESTKTAEINWRCTWLIIQNTQNINEVLLHLFKEKYPKYTDTLSVRIDKQDDNHIRGWVIFEKWISGWIFLATKINENWQIVHDWNWEISCELKKYWFTDDMLIDCVPKNTKNYEK